MADARQEFHNLYQAVHAERRGASIEVVDDLAEALMLHMEADLCALLVTGDHDEPLPVALCHGNEVEVVGVDLLRSQWSKHGSRGERFTDEETGLQEGDSDEFARQNLFSSSASYSYRSESGCEITVVIYWKSEGRERDLAADKLVQLLTQAAVAALAAGDRRNSDDDLTARLADLVAIFELNHTEVSFADTIARVLDTASVLLPVRAAGLLVRKGRTEPFSEYRMDHEHWSGEAVGSEVIDLVADRFSRLPAPGKAGWIELSGLDDSPGVIAAMVLEEPNLEYALALVRRDGSRLDAVGAQLVTLYMHSARSVIRHARAVQKLRRAHRALQKSSDKMAAMEALAAVSDMTTGVAHDFNNIIGGIVGRLQLMKMKTDDDKLFADLEKIERLALEGAETVKHIQEFATRTKYKKPEPIDLVQLIRTSVERNDADWYALAESKSLSISTSLPELSATVSGNGPDLICALDHLIENAAEHSPEGSEIVISLEAMSEHYRLSVIDSGPGVEEKLRNKVFYPFYSTKSERGAGLGLSIVYGTAVRHGGRVGCEEAPGGGACFFMDLEYTQQENPTETTGQIEVSSGVLNILVVDDDRLIREILSDMLTIDGHQTVACEDGFRALEAMEQQSFDLVITDLGMPGMSGLDLAGTIHQAHPDLPIAMITGWGTQLNHDEIKSKGIKMLLSKPFHLKDIKNIVARLVTGSSQPA